MAFAVPIFNKGFAWCLLGGYSAQAFKECIDYEVKEVKSADIPYVLTNLCELLSLTYYNLNP